MERKTCRKKHLEIRNQMRLEDVTKTSNLIINKLLNSEWYQQATYIYTYFPLENEVDCRPFLLQALSDGKRIALPRTRQHSQMDFYEIRSINDLEEGSFHVMEPKKHCGLVTEEEAVVLVPGVVFDQRGNRHGYGKGYYDRYFMRYPNLKKYALCYENQMEEELDTNPYDIPMNRIYTEKSTIFLDEK